jgi:hypothetical protein
MCGNLYDPHPVLITSGEFWRCEHGTTGYGANGLWEGCAPCAEKKAHTTEIAALRDKVERMGEIGDTLAALVDLSHERQHPACRRWQALRGESSDE